MVGILHPIVPLAIGGSAVSSRFKDLSNSGLIHIQALSPAACTIDTTSEAVAPGKQLGPGGGADRAYIEVFQGGTSC